jgi:hypothetical protein
VKAFIWTKNVSNSYGKDGFFIVLALTLAQARAQIQAYLDAVPSLEPTPDHLHYTRQTWQEWVTVNQQASSRNAQALSEILQQFQIVESRGLEPPGSYAGHCYDWNWDTLLTGEPDLVLDATVPRILAASYGYEG